MQVLIKSCHIILLASTAALVWIEHQAVFRSAGRTFRRFWNETWQEFTLLYQTSSANHNDVSSTVASALVFLIRSIPLRPS